VRPANGRRNRWFECDAYAAGRRATVNRERTVAFDEERLAIVKDRIVGTLRKVLKRYGH